MSRRALRLALRTAPKTNRRLRVEGLEDRTVPSFTVAPRFPVGPNNGLNTKPVSISAGDFNGDGKPDVAVARTDGKFVSVLLGNGDGSFGTSNDINIGKTPYFIKAVDVNGDGKLDLITADTNDNAITVLLGNGDGTFTPLGSFPTGAGTAPVAFDIADLNGDGHPDLVVADSGAPAVTLMLNDGFGNFTATGTVNVGNAPTSVAVADFNHDGLPDIATVSGGFGHLNITLNTGGGTFGPTTNFATGFCANGVTTGDFNHDGNTDVAVACVFPSGDGVSVLLGKGDGTFVTHPDGFGGQIPFISYSAGNQTPGFITTADVNGDGNTDLVTANFSSTGSFANNSISVLPRNPDGTFGPARVYHGGMAPAAVVVGDFNGDGKTDIVSCDSGGPVGTVSFLAGRGDGTFVASEAIPITVRNAASFNGVATGDFTGDGIPDLAVVTWNVNYNGITLFPSLGNGEFGPGIQTAPIANATGVAAGDFNGDHKLDLAVTSSAGVTILLGNGDGTFSVGNPLPAGVGPQWVTVADFNNDGKLDLAVADSSGAGGASILLGNGDGTFQSPLNVAVGGGGNFVAAADLNQDGNVDLVVTSGSNSAVTVVLGNGDGTFGTPTSYPAGAVGSVAVGDLNGDGFPDLAITSFIPPGGGGSAVLVRLNDGTGHFPTQNGSYPTDAFGSNPIGCQIMDVNGDGVPDIVAVNDFSDTVSIFSNTGSGTFAPQTTEVVGDRPTWVMPGDFNNDGRPDLAVVNSNSGSVTVLTRPAPATHFDVGADAGTVTAGDTFQMTVVARDAAGRPDPDFRGTVTFGTDDGLATLPDPYQFTAADGGTHTFDITPRTAGTHDVSVTGPLGTVHTNVTVTAADADHYRFDVPTSATAGAPFDITFTALDPFENVATGYTGTVHFQSNDPNPAASVPADFTFTAADAGTHTFTGGVTLLTAGARTITVTPSNLTMQLASLDVSPAAASRLTLGVPATAVAGIAGAVTVSAWDPYGNRATTFTGTVRFSSSDPIAALPADYPFVAGDQGSHTFQVTFKRAGAQSLAVAASGLTGDQRTGIQVSPTNPSQLAFVQEPVNTFIRTADPLPVTVQLEDPFGNPVARSVPVTLSLAANPGLANLLNATASTDFTGRATFPKLMLTRPGVGYTLVASSPNGSSPASDPFTVYTATHFKLTLTSNTATAGISFTLTVTALDGHNHLDPTYRGTVHVTSTSALADLPADYTFNSTDQGAHTFPVSLNTSGLRRLTVADTAKTTVKGRAAVTVAAGAATRFVVTGFPLSIKANSPHLFTVTAVDAYGNRATGYTGTVTFGSVGGAAVPLPSRFTAANHGRHSFVAKFPTAGTGLSLTVADQNDPTIAGSENGITVI
jgi:hypothetical protein